MDAKRLRDVPLFLGLSKFELNQVGRWTTELDLPAGQVLGRQGSVAYEFFVMEDGVVEVSIDGGRVAELGPGDFSEGSGCWRAIGGQRRSRRRHPCA